MGDELRFAADLYQGAAGHYDRCRLPYPGAMTGDLIQRTGVSGGGRLLDLACGTGQLAFPLRHWFSEAWAVDRNRTWCAWSGRRPKRWGRVARC